MLLHSGGFALALLDSLIRISLIEKTNHGVPFVTALTVLHMLLECPIVRQRYFSITTLTTVTSSDDDVVVCTLKAILKGDEEVKAWLDYESVPLDEVLLLIYCSCIYKPLFRHMAAQTDKQTKEMHRKKQSNTQELYTNIYIYTIYKTSFTAGV